MTNGDDLPQSINVEFDEAAAGPQVATNSTTQKSMGGDTHKTVGSGSKKVQKQVRRLTSE